MLIDLCDRMCAAGQRRLHVDMSAVTDCDRGGLRGLQLLASGVIDMEVDIDGLCWGQFMVLLGSAPTDGIDDLRDSVREVLHAMSSGAPRAVGHHPDRDVG